MRQQSRGGFDALTVGMMGLMGVAGGFLAAHLALGGSVADVRALWSGGRPAEATIMVARDASAPSRSSVAASWPDALFAAGGKSARVDIEAAPKKVAALEPAALSAAVVAEADTIAPKSETRPLPVVQQASAAAAPTGDEMGGVADTELVEDEILEAWGSVASVADLGGFPFDLKKSATSQLYLTSVSFPDEEPVVAAAPVEAAAPPVQASLADVEEFARAKAAPARTKTRSVVRIPFYPGLPLSRAKHFKGATGTIYEGRFTEAQFIAKEKKCLAEAIYFEARGEPILGQFAVAQTVLNRVRTDFYPDTVCEVVYQGVKRRSRACQFSFACDGIRDRTSETKHWEIAKEIADRVADGKVWLPEVGHASHYHATYVRPRWLRHMNKTSKVGRHIFYRDQLLPKPRLADLVVERVVN